MKHTNKILVFLIADLISLGFAACKKDEEKNIDKENDTIINEQTYEFNFDVSSNFLNSNSTLYFERFWLIVYYHNGEVLFEKELQNDSTYNVEIPDGKYTMQTIQHKDYFEQNMRPDEFIFYTYLEIEPGRWKFGEEVEEELSPIGEITLNLNDISFSGSYAYELKSSYTDNWSHNQSIYSIQQYFDPDNVWFMFYNTGEAPYYKWFPNLALNDSIGVTAAELNQMDGSVNIAFPTNTSNYMYIESEDDLTTDFQEKYMVYFLIGEDGETSQKAYYPQGLFSGYYTSLNSSNENIQDRMIKSRGSIPESMEQLDASITITNNSVENFTATLNSDADVCSHYWNNEDNVKSIEARFRYEVVGPTDFNYDLTYEALPIPDYIQSLNPEVLDLSKLGYSYTKFSEYDLLEGYNSYIEAYKEEQRDLYKDGVKYLIRYIYADPIKDMSLDDQKAQLQRTKQNPYQF